MILEEPQDNYGSGWISIYRSIKNHWIFENDKWFKWWVLILFEVNHNENKITIGYDVIEIKKGQSAKSIRTWSRLFGCGTKQATKFFDMLEKDKMITREIIGKGKQSTTLINVSNYVEYQDLEKRKRTSKGNARETQGKRKRHTNNNDNNYNNENNENNIPSISDFLEYGLTKEKNIDKTALELKYYSWVENNWKDGNGKEIKNWKSKLLNTLPYIKKNEKPNPFKNLTF